MNKLEVAILKELDSTKCSKQKVVQSCAKITTDYMKGLADWINNCDIYKHPDGKWYNRYTTEFYANTSAMIEEYIKTL